MRGSKAEQVCTYVRIFPIRYNDDDKLMEVLQKLYKKWPFADKRALILLMLQVVGYCYKSVTDNYSTATEPMAPAVATNVSE